MKNVALHIIRRTSLTFLSLPRPLSLRRKRLDPSRAWLLRRRQLRTLLTYRKSSYNDYKEDTHRYTSLLSSLPSYSLFLCALATPPIPPTRVTEHPFWKDCLDMVNTLEEESLR